MKLTIKKIDLSIHSAVINVSDFEKEVGSDQVPYNVKIAHNNGLFFIHKVLSTQTLVNPGEMGLSQKTLEENKLSEGESVEIAFNFFAPGPQQLIEEWIKGTKPVLDKEGFDQIVSGFMNKNISSHHASAFILKQHFQEMKLDEIEAMARSFADSGSYFEYSGPIMDKHSIGGVPGNKISLIIVPIIAAAGLTIPKISTHAITSPSGTIDSMGVLAPIDFTLSEVKEIIRETKGAIVYSGEKMGIAPVVDKVISDAGFPLGLDPESVFLAGILAKKLGMGVDFMVLDIPIGRGTKVPDEEAGRGIGRKFVELASRLGIRAEAALTYGSVPVGHSIGPLLEAREALLTLENKGPTSLVEKSSELAGIIFEISGVKPRGEGKKYAKKILTSGKALSKMKDIIKVQGGDASITPKDLTEQLKDKPFLKYQAPSDGWPVQWNNTELKEIARIAGAPLDPSSGIEILSKKESVKQGEEVFRVYASNDNALDNVRAYMAKHRPVIIESVLLERVA